MSGFSKLWKAFTGHKTGSERRTGRNPNLARLLVEVLEDRVVPTSGTNVTIAAFQNGAEAVSAVNVTDGIFRVTRDNTVGNLTVSYVLDSTNSTATSGSDFSALSGSILIPDGQAFADIHVIPAFDSAVEGPETIKVNLLNGCGGCCGGSTYTAASPGTATLSITDDDLEITANDVTMTYGDGTILNGVLGFTSNGLHTGDAIDSLTLTTDATISASGNWNVGTWTIFASAATGTSFNAANYSITYMVGTLTINKATLTVTADPQSKAYGDANPTLTATITGFVNSEDETVLSGLAGLSTTADATSPVGTYTITSAIGTLSATNYSFAFVDDDLTVNFDITNPGLQSSFDGDAITLALVIAGSSNTLSYSDSGLPTGLSVNESGVIVGTIASDAHLGSQYHASITVTAASAGVSTSLTFDWSVAQPTIAVTNPGDQANSQGDSLTLAIAATNTAGHVLTYQKSGLPDGLDIDSATGIIFGTIADSADVETPYAVTITATDSASGVSSSVSFNWEVSNMSPVAFDQTYYVQYNSPYDFSLLDNTEHATDTVIPTGPYVFGLTLNADGTYTFTPPTDTSGTYTLTFVGTRGTQTSNMGTITFVVLAQQPITIASKSYTTIHGQALSLSIADLLTGHVALNSNPVELNGYDQPLNGTVAPGTSGYLVYTPNAGFVGTDSFRIGVSDGSNTIDALVTIDVTNNFIDTSPRFFDVLPETTLTVTEPTIPSSDEDGDALTVGVTQSPSYAQQFSFNNDGTFVYQPITGFLGLDYIIYNISDGIDIRTVIVELVVGNVLVNLQGQQQSTFVTRATTLIVPALDSMGLATLENMILAARGSNDSVTGADAVAAATMRRYYPFIVRLGGAGQTTVRPNSLRELQQLYNQAAQARAANPAAVLTADQALALEIENAYVAWLAQLNALTANPANRTLYGTTGAPNANDVRQGATGDCGFLSTVISNAALQVQPGYTGRLIQGMIQQVPLDGGGRRFDVTFPGQAAIQVADPTDSELALYANAGPNGGIWVAVLEKAYCQRVGSGMRTLFSRGGNPVAQDNLRHGEIFFNAMSVMTNNNSAAFHFGTAPPANNAPFIDVFRGIFGNNPAMGQFLNAQGNNAPADNVTALRNNIAATVRAGRMVNLASFQRRVNIAVPAPAAGMPNQGTIVAPHNWAIVGVTGDGANTRFIIQNPHNEINSEARGFGARFTVDIDFLRSNFDAMIVQTRLR